MACLRYSSSVMKNFKSFTQKSTPGTKTFSLASNLNSTSLTTEMNDFEIDSNVLRKLERLSLLTFCDDKEYIDFFKHNIEFVNKLSELDTDGIEPMYTVMEDIELPLREDIAEAMMHDDVLQNADKQFEGYFVAPKGNVSLHTSDFDGTS